MLLLAHIVCQPSCMILNFKHKALEKFFNEGKNKGIPKQFEKKIKARLEVIDAAEKVSDIHLPSYRLHELGRDRKGTWSVTVAKNWCITFKFQDGNAYDVDYEDYH
ncbi:MAG: type II toxin-antitoxin system RelE/ParE family toxin [Leptolyngbyaceae cyanobacterium bins.302]|nr:type II toxin-antitoxin system RelE/ParE family toxin [Leptolyngbyaceae cyanobacterium bins.302]